MSDRYVFYSVTYLRTDLFKEEEAKPALETYFSESPAVLGILNDAETRLGAGTSASDMLQSLFQEQYHHYTDTLPWLHRNTNIAYIQFVMNNHQDIAFSYIWRHPGSGFLKTKLLEELPSQSNSELVNNTLALLYLCCDSTDSLVTHSFNLCMEKCSDFNLQEMDVLGSILRSIKDRGFSYKAALARLENILDDKNHKWTKADVQSLGSLATLFMFVTSGHLLDRMHSRLVSTSNDPQWKRID